MKIKDGFILREIIGTWVIVPIGERIIEFSGLTTLNKTGAFLWQKLENEITKEELLKAVINEFEIDDTTAKKDVEEFVCELMYKGLIK